MRRKDREVTELSQLEEIIRKCDCIHLGLLDGDYPYVVPMNFGYERTGDQFTFYMHAASEGKKLELIKAHPQASFCMDTGHELVKGEAPVEFPDEMMHRVVILKLNAKNLTGKQHK